MKTKLKKSLALLLLIALPLSYSSIAYAHTHRFTIYVLQETSFVDFGAFHSKYLNTLYECSCGQSMWFNTNIENNISHSFSAYARSGSHYHKGTKHYLEYARTCSYCNRRESYYEAVNCGGPPCTLPY